MRHLAEASLKEKIPEMENSLTLLRNMNKKRLAEETVISRYSLADDIFGKAELQLQQNSVNLWLGANVILEYTFDEAIDFLSTNAELARTEYAEVKNDLALVRNQIVTSEVSMSRIFNWDVRRKRQQTAQAGATKTAPAAAAAAAVKN